VPGLFKLFKLSSDSPQHTQATKDAINWKGKVVFNGFTSNKSYSATAQNY